MMSSGHGATTDVERQLRLLRSANLPEKVRGLTRKSFGSKAAILLDYLSSDAYASDYEDGKGVCLTGDASIRSDLLALMAKGQALGDRSVWFCSLHYLVSILDHGGEEERSKLAKRQNLFIDWFEKDFGSDACPYTYMQRAEVEEFLSVRLRAGLITNFSAWAEWRKLRWWSADFKSLYQPKVVNVTI